MFVLLLVLLLILCYRYGTKDFKYWEKRGVKYESPTAFIGNHIKVFLNQKSMSQLAEDFYLKYPNEKIIGSFRSTRPELMIRDPEIVKRILVTDSSYFHRRSIFRNKNLKTLMRNLFFAEGDLWKLLRQRMTPAFTSGKLKAMFPLIVERAEKLQARALKAAASMHSLDARDLMARYTIDFIGACGFGIDLDTLSDDKSAFRELAVKIFEITKRDALFIALQEMFPNTFCNFSILTRCEEDFTKLVKKILKQRNYKPCGRNDFIDLLLECKNKGVIIGESIEKVKPDGTPEIAQLEMDVELIAAQVFVFFAAGFETSSSATSFTLHQLAFNQDIQKKVQDEIDTILAKYNDKLCYDAVKEMTYLEWTFKEGMRMFPSLGFLNRESAMKYTIPEVNVTIDEGVVIMMSLQGLQNDPKYFKNPDEFRPERFDPKEFDINNKFVYLPFGDGQRGCIGARLGLMQSLAGLAAILSKFTVTPSKDTKRYPVIDTSSHVVQRVKDGLPLLFNERKRK